MKSLKNAGRSVLITGMILSGFRDLFAIIIEKSMCVII